MANWPVHRASADRAQISILSVSHQRVPARRGFGEPGPGSALCSDARAPPPVNPLNDDASFVRGEGVDQRIFAALAELDPPETVALLRSVLAGESPDNIGGQHVAAIHERNVHLQRGRRFEWGWTT
jgi:hypothetical protein